MHDATLLLKAIAIGDAATASDMDSRLSADDREYYFLVTMGLFAGAVGHRFGDEPSRDDILAFVDEARSDYRDAEPPINPLNMEAMIRAIYGEEHLADFIPAVDQFAAAVPIIRKIVLQTPALRDHIDDYLTDAETLATTWMADDAATA